MLVSRLDVSLALRTLRRWCLGPRRFSSAAKEGPAKRLPVWLFPVPEERKAVYRSYQLAFDDAGCPMKAMPQGLVFHPILAAYLIADYMRWQANPGSPEYLEHARRVARQALARAEQLQDALVFYYEPETGLSSVPGRFYSALTQARYLVALLALRKHAGTEFDAEIAAIYRSLLVPVDQGGCFIRHESGWIVEEYPHTPPLYTLNGWLTVIKIVADGRASLEELGCDTETFLRENMRAVRQLLPLYDAGFCANSRYQLTGFTRIEVVFDGPVRHQLRSFAVEIPGVGTFQGALTKAATRWGVYLEEASGNVLRFNVVLSLASHPQPNVFLLQADVDRPCTATVRLAHGTYSPDSTSIPITGFRTVGEFRLAPGQSDIRAPLPWDGEDLFAYPTNFLKRIDRKTFNAYHYIHVTSLAWLHAYSGEETFKQYALKWLSYTERWPQMKLLQSPGITLLPQNNDQEGFRTLVSNILARRPKQVRL
jgi:hypothetical protein